MSYALHWIEPRQVFRQFEGHVSGRELAESFRRILGAPQFDALRLNLADLTRVTAVDVSDAEVDLLAATVYGASATNRGLKVGVIAPHALARQLLRRYLAVGVSPYDVQSLGSYAQANAWLASCGATFRLGDSGELRVD